MDSDNYHERSRDNWNRVARGWEAQRDTIWRLSGKVGEYLVNAIDPQPGEVVLELAAGVGDTGFLAAQRIGDEGKLITSDFAPKMLEAARRAAEKLGLSNVEFRLLDAENMYLARKSVDAVLCRWGYMLMADPLKALSETRRVLRPGGRLAFSVFAAPEHNPWATIAPGVLVDRGHLDAPLPGTPGMFALSDPERLKELLREADFGECQIHELSMTYTYPDREAFLNFHSQLAAGLSSTLSTLKADEQARVKEMIYERLEPFAADEGLAIPARTLNVVAAAA